MNTLLAAHVASDPAEATLVLAVVAAWHGLKADGAQLAEVEVTAPTLRAIAAELGLQVGAVRRGVCYLAAAGVLSVDRLGVHVTADALRARWERRSATIRLGADVRRLGLRSWPLLVAGLVAGHLDRRGRLVAGTKRLMAMTGLPRRTLQRAMDTAEAAGAMHRWTVPVTWQLCLAPGPRREVAQEKRRELAQEKPAGSLQRRELAQENGGEPASRNGAPPPREMAQETASRSGASTSDTEYNPSDARARARADRSEPDPELALQRAIERTSLRDRLPPFPRRLFAIELAKALNGDGMLAADLDALWALAQRRAASGDAGGLLAHWLAGCWRDVLLEPGAKDRHADACARGAAAQAAEARDGPYAAPAPRPAAEVLEQVLAHVRLG